MSFKKAKWTPYSRKAKSVEINVKDNENQTIDFFKIYKGKTRDAEKVINKIKDKYDFELMPLGEKPKEKQKEKSVLDKDLSW